MARPYDWTPLGLSGDPVPGEPSTIRASATKLSKIAGMIDTQASRLRTLSTTEGWDSESGEKFHTDSGKLADAIAKARGRYDGVGAALSTYADDLLAVQQTADGYLQDAVNAQHAQHLAQNTTVPAKDDPAYADAHAKQKKALDSAGGDLSTARANIQSLIGDHGAWTAANDKAAKAIRDASDDDLKDGFWDGFKDWVHGMKQFLDSIKEVLEIIGTILAIAILVLSLIVPGANIIGALLLAALIVSVLNLIVVGAQAIAGDASLADVGWAALSVVLSVVGLKVPPMSLAGNMGGGLKSILFSKAGSSIEDAVVGKFTGKLIYSISHAEGARAGAGAYSAAYRSMKATLTEVGESKGLVNTINTLSGSDFATALKITSIATSARAGELLRTVIAVDAGFAFPEVVSRIHDIRNMPETYHNALDLVSHGWSDFVDSHSRVTVGSL